ncbi:MAG: extracellular solute-binding protein, partial [Armatimonadota bacterium]|nr:extracellular solute-binding protein [Armatimonadota bacterium]
MILLGVFVGCRHAQSPTPAASNRVVLYCSVDDVYARPIIRDLEKRTGLRIDALYDTEAAKTAGLANRIRAERDRPRGDVFWSSALLQTLLLNREGLLQPYQSPAASNIPRAFRAADGAWTGLGARPRVIVYHQSVKNPPRSLQDLLQPRFKDKVGISNPQFGTASDWVAALATRWGRAKTLNYFRALKKNGVRVLAGNSVVADKVHRGELLAGVTDSDDFLAQMRKTSDGIRVHKLSATGTADVVLIPGSVAVLAKAPHPQAARRLMDALLSAATEQQLVKQMPGVLPLRRS